MNTKIVKLPIESVRMVLEIEVKNHAGVMSHVVGLFSRRACNVERIVCLPNNDGLTSRVWFMVTHDEKMPRMIKHLANLEDVLAVRRRDECYASFEQLEALFP